MFLQHRKPAPSSRLRIRWHLCLPCSSPRYPHHRFISPPPEVFAQVSPLFTQPFFLIFFAVLSLDMLYYYLFIVFHFSDFCPFYSLVYPQFLWHCLVHSRCSINICWAKDHRNTIPMLMLQFISVPGTENLKGLQSVSPLSLCFKITYVFRRDSSPCP